ncbi:MAG: tetratricopeptide repeat protein [Cyanobacteriota bacterium]|nr:tetratricopeptide repeat protein [Cyanobacteriota bacterium]
MRSTDLPTCAAAANSAGLEQFAAGDPDGAERLLRHAYRLRADEPAILVNLGLALMQRGQVNGAERCYRLALGSPDLRTRRSAAKNLGFLLLWRGQFADGWHWHGQRFRGEPFEASQWRGEPLNGAVLTIWNDVGMGDAFHFVRYTLPLVQRGERVRWAVEASQIALFRERLAWPLHAVVDRNSIDRLAGPQVPLMGLIPIVDPSTRWGRSFAQPSWRAEPADQPASAVGLCWASNPADRTMHAYKSTSAEHVQALAGQASALLSLQTDEAQAHRRLGLEPPRRDWIATLDRIAGCQRVVSVDTAVAHLAGGLGKPLELLLGDPPDWRWRRFEQLGHNLWYPNLHCQPLRPLAPAHPVAAEAA